MRCILAKSLETKESVLPAASELGLLGKIQTDALSRGRGGTSLVLRCIVTAAAPAHLLHHHELDSEWDSPVMGLKDRL